MTAGILSPYRDYELIPIPTGHRFDLGGGYEVEAIPLRGHSAGQCAYLDHHNHIIFTGDIGGAGRKYEGDPAPTTVPLKRCGGICGW